MPEHTYLTVLLCTMCYSSSVDKVRPEECDLGSLGWSPALNVALKRLLRACLLFNNSRRYLSIRQ